MDEHKTLRFAEVRATRMAKIQAPHIKPLTAFVEKMRLEKGPGFEIPYFDPADGGLGAKVLFLLEAPGSKAIGSGFVSRDNPDDTAKNIFVMSREAGLGRKDSVLWNVCPWYVDGPKKIRAVKAKEVREAEMALRWLLGQLDALQCVALMGRKAQLAKATVQSVRPDLQIVCVPHPSPSNIHRKPGNRAAVLEGFKQVFATLA